MRYNSYNIYIFYTMIFFLVSCVFAEINEILHVTDIHYDPWYYPSSANICLFGTHIGTGCCRKTSIGIKNYNQASKYGDLQCDLPLLTVNLTFNWIYNKHPNLKYIFYTGDTVDHHDITQSVNGNLHSINSVSNLFKSNFPDVPVYSVLGNHDTYPIDQTAPYLYKYMLEKISNYWKDSLTTESINLMKNYGYYSQELNSKLNIIGFNSIYYDHHNFFQVNSDSLDEKKTNSQFKYLKMVLEKSKLENKKVIILNHIPIQGGESIPYYNSQLSSIIDEYSDVILLHLNGHEHSDHFYIYKKSTTLSSFSLIPNSMTTSGHYPGFRILYYDTINNKFINYKQYSCNITNIIKTSNFSCNELYDFNSLYQEEDLSLKSFGNIFNKLKTNITLLNQYLLFKNYGTIPVEKCTEDTCINNTLNDILKYI